MKEYDHTIQRFWVDTPPLVINLCEGKRWFEAWRTRFSGTHLASRSHPPQDSFQPVPQGGLFQSILEVLRASRAVLWPDSFCLRVYDIPFSWNTFSLPLSAPSSPASLLQSILQASPSPLSHHRDYDPIQSKSTKNTSVQQIDPDYVPAPN